MMKWCRITALNLSNLSTTFSFLSESTAAIRAEGAGRLAAVLGQCASLAHLDLGGNEIGAEGARRLAAIQSRCRVLF